MSHCNKSLPNISFTLLVFNFGNLYDDKAIDTVREVGVDVEITKFNAPFKGEFGVLFIECGNGDIKAS